MYLSKSDLTHTPRIRRLNLINSVSGIKSGNLVGTISNDRKPNLAIFSSVVHLGSDPALLGFVLRPEQEVRRHTYENILENHCYTINHIHQDFVLRAHYTSAKFEKGESEFERCGLREEYLFDFKAPFVKESRLKMGVFFQEECHIKSNDTRLIVGEIAHLLVPDEAVDAAGHIDLDQIADVGISGLNSYYRLQKVAQFPYARPNELPSFEDELA